MTAEALTRSWLPTCAFTRHVSRHTPACAPRHNSREANRRQKDTGCTSIYHAASHGSRRHARSRLTCLAASQEHSLQLATAKLPASLNVDTFKKRMYDWAATLTSSGQNMPFSLPLRTRQTAEGFEMALLRINNGEPVPVATIATSIEEVEGMGSIFFVRFYEGRGASLVRTAPLPSDPYERLKTIINGLVDIPTIMGTMKTAIRQAASQAGQK